MFNVKLLFLYNVSQLSCLFVAFLHLCGKRLVKVATVKHRKSGELKHNKSMFIATYFSARC